MRNIIVAALILASCTAAAPQAAPVNYNAFGIAALRGLTTQSKTQNVFISPVSIGIALSMAAQGARGATQTQLLAALHVSGSNLGTANAALINELSGNTDASVGVADALWTRSDVQPNEQYVSLLAKQYGAQAQALQFGDPSAAQTINDWTKAHTFGLIDRIVDQTHSQDFLYLTNAMAFKGNWTLPFKKEQTRPMPFTNADGSKSTVQMMTQSAMFQSFEAPRFSALRMPYGHGGYAAYILLPHGNSTAALLAELTPATLDRIARGMHQDLMRVGVPRFTAKYSQSLIPLLESMGVTDAFGAHADFTGIHAIPPALAITSVNHAAYVRVDEQGTTAAAATSVGMTMLAIVMPKKSFIVDRPFVLAIRDEHTGSLLFIGVIRTLAD